MAYVDQARAKNRKGAIIMVGAIHAVIGYGLIVGLAPGIFSPPVPQPFEGTHITLPVTPPPPETPQPTTENPDPVRTQAYTPPMEFSLNPDPVIMDTTEIILSPVDWIEPIPGTQTIPEPIPSATTPSFTRTDVKPRNDPGSWVTPNDYRSSWINREMIGTAGFKLQVGTNGRAESCLITRSSGHAALDKATCDLISKRARFNPAKNSNNEKVSGSYSSSVRWQLPD